MGYSWITIFYQILAVLLFLHAFMPVKQNIPGYSSLQDLPDEPSILPVNGHGWSQSLYKPAIKRLVFVVIDALRTDFVIGQDGAQYFPQLHKLIDANFAQIFSGRTHAPTVTMPRIKALTSGTIPGFIDVILNFDTAKFADDNIITQAYLNKKRLVFYGDETWLQLFPDHFVRSDGTTSFFVTDFSEVDNNVTRHLRHELETLDWDVLILHYLGLDHIGHVHGPQSRLIPSKLLEMDWVLHQIFSAINSHDKETGEASALFVCGDHGMSDSGGHGGSTTQETSVPLIFVHSRPVAHRKRFTPALTIIPQISITSTLSALMGLPIPKNNVGPILPDVLWQLDTRNLLYAMYLTGIQLQKIVQDCCPGFVNESGFENAVDIHRHWLQMNSPVDTKDVVHAYNSGMLRMMKAIESTMVQYDFVTMIISISVLWMIVLYLVVQMQPVGTPRVSLPKCVIGFISIILLRCAGCMAFNVENKLCHNTPMTLVVSMVMFAVITLLSVELVSAIQRGFSSSKLCISSEFFKSPFRTFALCSWLLHSLSLLSSSFVEEEHQTWYFLSVSLHIVMICGIGGQQSNSATTTHIIATQPNQTSNTVYSLPLLKNVNHQEGKSSDHQLALRNESKSKPSSTLEDTSESTTSGYLWLVIASAACCRICRSWNQTGDKWAHLPDIKSWLNRSDSTARKNLYLVSDYRSEQRGFLSFGIACSLLAIFMVRRRNHFIVLQILLLVGFALVYCYHYTRGSVLIPLFPVTKITRGLLEGRLTILLVVVILLWPLVTKSLKPASCLRLNSLHSIVTAWLLMNCLLARPHNIILIALFVIQEQLIGHILKYSKFDLESSAIVYLILGMASFFQQGNSNSLSRLDVAAGYVGISNYWFGAIITLVWCNTYSGFGFWIFRMLECNAARFAASRMRFNDAVDRVTRVLCLSRGLPLAIFFTFVTFQHQHLFIWSVLTPKLLYEGMHTVFIAIVIVLGYLLSPN